jgi:xanthine dehydrogenase accessory factor
MTHSHPLDYRLCEALLAQGRVARLGLIGSRTKAARFRSRLRRDPACAPALARLVSPIGMPGITGKEPAVIAVSVAAQLLAWRTMDDRQAIATAEIAPTELAVQWP